MLPPETNYMSSTLPNTQFYPRLGGNMQALNEKEMRNFESQTQYQLYAYQTNPAVNQS